MEVLYLAERRKKEWEAQREQRGELRKCRRRMGKPAFYLCPIFRIIFALDCWDHKATSFLFTIYYLLFIIFIIYYLLYLFVPHLQHHLRSRLLGSQGNGVK